MTTKFIFIQAIGFLGTILFFLSFQCKSNKNLFRVQFVSYLCYTVHLLMLGAITGGVAGLVAITPAAGFVDVPASIIIGFVTAFVSYFAIYYLKAKFGYDDALDVFGVHGLSGVWGAIATGIFASPAINGAAGLLFGNPGQLTIQIISIIVTAAYAFVISIILAKILDKTIGIRVDEKAEIEGLDANLHKESGYRL